MKPIQIVFLLMSIVFSGPSAAEQLPDESSHAAAIRLVMKARESEVKKLEQRSDWWDDVKERAWSAKRPCHSGLVDCTHLFKVTYSIDGRVVARWSVDTRTGKVGAVDELIPK